MNRILTGVLVALVATLVQLAPCAAQEDASSMLAAARKQEKQAVGVKGAARVEALEAALITYGKVPELWPAAHGACARAHLGAAEILRRLGRSEAALDAYDRTLTVPGEDALRARALSRKAGLLRRLKRPADAQAALESIVRDFEGEERAVFEARIDLGKLAKSRKRWREALEQGERVLADSAESWRHAVEAADLVVGVHVKRRAWREALEALDRIDGTLRQRFGETEDWARVDKAMAGMSSRRMLTPIPEGGEES